MAKNIVLDAKADYPAACNAMVFNICHTKISRISLLLQLFLIFTRKHFFFIRIWCKMVVLVSFFLNLLLKVYSFTVSPSEDHIRLYFVNKSIVTYK